MNDKVPFFLSEAQVSLWLAGSDGNPTGATLFIGGFANRLNMRLEYEEMRLAGSGEAYQSTQHTDESHFINFGQSWLVNWATQEDWRPSRNTRYVLQLLWTSANLWLRRTYYGVTWQNMRWEAPTPNQFLTDQNLRAQRYVADSGVLAMTPGTPEGLVTGPPPVTPAAPAPALEQPVAFFRENPLIVGEYLLGFYSWSEGVTLGNVQLIAWAPQVTPTVLGLEVGGVLTGQTITIPVGAANTEVTASAAMSVAVPANTLVRWKVLSGPDPANAAWSCALTCLATT